MAFPAQFPRNTGPDGKTGEVLDEELDFKGRKVGDGGGLCGAVTHVHVVGERHKEVIVPRGWSPQSGGLCWLIPSPQWVQGPESSVDSAKWDPVGKGDTNS